MQNVVVLMVIGLAFIAWVCWVTWFFCKFGNHERTFQEIEDFTNKGGE